MKGLSLPACPTIALNAADEPLAVVVDLGPAADFPCYSEWIATSRSDRATLPWPIYGEPYAEYEQG